MGQRVAPSRWHEFERQVAATIRRGRLLSSEDHVLVALSGGPDSTALLATMRALAGRGLVASVTACHVDHRLRPDSALDAAFCAELCEALSVALVPVVVDVARDQNVQAAARRERYRALARVADERGATAIATGHTRSDQAETVLHRLLRGAGARGLASIPLRRGRIVRPLLERSRAEVLAYLEARGIQAHEDPSNRSPRYLRNRIRRDLLPQLETLAPGIERRLARTAALLRDDDRFLERLARQVVPGDTASALVGPLRAAPLAVRRRALRRLWRASTGSRRGLGAEHVESLVALLRRRAPGSIDLPGGVVAKVAYGRIELAGARADRAAPFETIVVDGEGTYDLPGRGVVELRWPAATEPPWPLEVRTRRPGDRFRPAGGRGAKKLKAWLIDQKVPRARRDALVVVADRSGRVLCLPELGAIAAGAIGLSVRLRYCKRKAGLL